MGYSKGYKTSKLYKWNRIVQQIINLILLYNLVFQENNCHVLWQLGILYVIIIICSVTSFKLKKPFESLEQLKGNYFFIFGFFNRLLLGVYGSLCWLIVS